jgi:uncharacterized membrane protein
MTLSMLNLVPAAETSFEMKYWIELISLGIEMIAVIIIVFAVLYGTLQFVFQTLRKQLVARERYRQYKHRLGRALLLSLEILVAADVIRTVALDPSLANVSVLGLLVLIRTFLSWSLVVEIEGHWPWQPKNPEPEETNAG